MKVKDYKIVDKKSFDLLCKSLPKRYNLHITVGTINSKSLDKLEVGEPALGINGNTFVRGNL